MFIIIILTSALITGYGFSNMENVPTPKQERSK